MERKCEFCGEQIPRERLEALPNTRRCVKCAQKNGSDIRGLVPDAVADYIGEKELYMCQGLPSHPE